MVSCTTICGSSWMKRRVSHRACEFAASETASQLHQKYKNQIMNRTCASLAGVFIAVAFLLPARMAFTQGSLEAGFANPPDSAKPRVWWHWIGGNVTKEGIT